MAIFDFFFFVNIGLGREKTEAYCGLHVRNLMGGNLVVKGVFRRLLATS